jgi:hypothetical protein
MLKEWNPTYLKLLKCNGISKELRCNSRKNQSGIFLTKNKLWHQDVWVLHISFRMKTNKFILPTLFHILTLTCFIFSKILKKNINNSSKLTIKTNQLGELPFPFFLSPILLGIPKNSIIFQLEGYIPDNLKEVGWWRGSSSTCVLHKLITLDKKLNLK